MNIVHIIDNYINSFVNNDMYIVKFCIHFRYSQDNYLIYCDYFSYMLV